MPTRTRPDAAPAGATTAAPPVGHPSAGDGSTTPTGGGTSLRIGNAAAAVGVSARTLRYYEELGLLSPSGHTAGGERRYRPGDLVQLQRILELREVLGMNLDEIRGVLVSENRLDELRAAYRANRDVRTRRARRQQEAVLREALQLNESLAEQLNAKLARMDSFRAKLAGDAARCRELLAELATGGG